MCAMNDYLGAYGPILKLSLGHAFCLLSYVPLLGSHKH